MLPRAESHRTSLYSVSCMSCLLSQDISQTEHRWTLIQRKQINLRVSVQPDTWTQPQFCKSFSPREPCPGFFSLGKMGNLLGPTPPTSIRNFFDKYPGIWIETYTYLELECMRLWQFSWFQLSLWVLCISIQRIIIVFNLHFVGCTGTELSRLTCLA